MKGIDLRLTSLSDEFLFKSVVVRHPRGSLSAPTVAVKAHLRGMVGEGPYVAELYREFTPRRLRNAMSDTRSANRLRNDVVRGLRKVKPSDMVIAIPCLVRGNDVEWESLSPRQVGHYIFELIAAPRVDVLCTPTFFRVNEEYASKVFRWFLDAASTAMKPVALTIPYVSRDTRVQLIESFFEFLETAENGLHNIICVDYGGSNAISRHDLHNFVLRLIRGLRSQMGEDIMIYGVNVKFSRVTSKYDEVPARDVISTCGGVDVLGPNHRGPVLAPDVINNVKAESRLMFFQADTYTYVSKKGARIPGSSTHGNISDLERRIIFNVENSVRIRKELDRVRGLLSSGEPIKEYLLSKKGVARDRRSVDLLDKYRREYLQSSLV